MYDVFLHGKMHKWAKTSVDPRPRQTSVDPSASHSKDGIHSKGNVILGVLVVLNPLNRRVIAVCRVLRLLPGSAHHTWRSFEKFNQLMANVESCSLFFGFFNGLFCVFRCILYPFMIFYVRAVFCLGLPTAALVRLVTLNRFNLIGIPAFQWSCNQGFSRLSQIRSCAMQLWLTQFGCTDACRAAPEHTRIEHAFSCLLRDGRNPGVFKQRACTCNV